MSARVSATIVTGFLGSGKTTLLKRLLTEPGFELTAVIINELGEIALDHDLVAFSSDSTIVLPGGCVCCTIREDIETSLRELFEARDAGRIPPFEHLVIETTGIADPVPLLMTLYGNPLALRRLLRPYVLTIVDGVLGDMTLDAAPEAVSQVANADTIIISKIDMAADANALSVRLRSINPFAAIEEANLTQHAAAPLVKPRGDARERDLQTIAGGAIGQARAHAHVQSFSMRVSTPLDWTTFGVWMTMLLHCHGDRVLRIKGLLNVQERSAPTVFHCAQHLVHPPEHLEQWPSDDRDSRLVFITRDLELAVIQRSLLAFNALSPILIEDRSHYKMAGGGGSIAGRPVKRPTTPRWIRG